MGDPQGLFDLLFRGFVETALVQKLTDSGELSEAELALVPKLLSLISQQTNGLSNGFSNGSGPTEAISPAASPADFKTLTAEDIQTWLVNRIAQELGVEPEEIKRGSTLKTSVFDFQHGPISHSIIDTPGSSSFIVDTICAMRAADAALLLVGAVSGLKVQGEKAWLAAKREGIASAIYINELDKERASFEAALSAIESNLEIKPLVLQLPVGVEAELRGVTLALYLRQLQLLHTNTL